MKTKEIYKEVVCDYFDEYEKCWCVDAWTDPEQEDNGCVVARIDGESGNVYYMDDAAKDSPLAQEIIKQKQAEVRAERKQRKGELGETIAMLTAQVWGEVYGQMRDPDCTQLSCAIRDAAYRFETKWNDTPSEQREGYYIDMIDEFTKELIKEFKAMYC